MLGPIRAAVLGHFGECSPDIHHLVRAAAESLAATRWRAMGARSESEARGYFMNTVRKELSICFWTALARHRQNRLEFVGISRADVQLMRDQQHGRRIAQSQYGYIRGVNDSSAPKTIYLLHKLFFRFLETIRGPVCCVLACKRLHPATRHRQLSIFSLTNLHDF